MAIHHRSHGKAHTVLMRHWRQRFSSCDDQNHPVEFSLKKPSCLVLQIYSCVREHTGREAEAGWRESQSSFTSCPWANIQWWKWGRRTRRAHRVSIFCCTSQTSSGEHSVPESNTSRRFSLLSVQSISSDTKHFLGVESKNCFFFFY